MQLTVQCRMACAPWHTLIARGMSQDHTPTTSADQIVSGVPTISRKYLGHPNLRRTPIPFQPTASTASAQHLQPTASSAPVSGERQPRVAFQNKQVITFVDLRDLVDEIDENPSH